MATIRRLTDSCLLVTTDDHSTLFDPGFHTFTTGTFDLGSIGDVSRVFVTHEHRDHLHPEFLQWLLDRRQDLAVYSNQAVADILESHEIAVDTGVPEGTSIEDVIHEVIPNGSAPPNRSFTLDDLFTHPGDSRQPTNTAPVLALPPLVPWDSATGGVEFARRLKPRQVIPIHDFYLTEAGRQFVANICLPPLEDSGIEFVQLDWGDSYTV